LIGTHASGNAVHDDADGVLMHIFKLSAIGYQRSAISYQQI